MAWIESHQSLKEHPKTLRLAELLDVEVPSAIGYLHCFWWWCLDYAETGDLSKFTARTIARGSLWTGEGELFLTALIKAGFVDQEGETRLLHDWGAYTGKLISSRQEQRHNKRLGGLARAQAASRNQQGRYTSPAASQQDTSSQPGYRPAESPASPANQPTNSVPTVTNQETDSPLVPKKEPFPLKGEEEPKISENFSTPTSLRTFTTYQDWHEKALTCTSDQQRTALLIDLVRTHSKRAPPKDAGGRAAAIVKRAGNGNFGYAVKLLWDGIAEEPAGDLMQYVLGILGNQQRKERANLHDKRRELEKGASRGRPVKTV